MKAIDCIKGFCYGFTEQEQCTYVLVPVFDKKEEFLQWQIDYFGFTPSLKQGAFYLVVWSNENFRNETQEFAPDHEVFVESQNVKFYEIEQ